MRSAGKAAQRLQRIFLYSFHSRKCLGRRAAARGQMMEASPADSKAISPRAHALGLIAKWMSGCEASEAHAALCCGNGIEEQGASRGAPDLNFAR